MKVGFQTFNFLKTKIQAIQKPNVSLVFTNYPLKADSFEKSNNQICFQGVSCATSAFEITDVENLHCPICDNLMLSEMQIKEFTHAIVNKKGEDLIKALDTYGREAYWTKEEDSYDKKIYSKKRQQVVNVLKKLAVQNPELDLSGLVKLRAQQCARDLSSKELAVLIELSNYASEKIKNSDERRALLYEIEKGWQAAKRVDEDAFKRKKFLYAIKDISSNPDVQNEINDIAQKLPTSINDTDAFFVKYSKNNRNNYEIARSLVKGNVPTAEHLICQSDGGRDYIENYLCDCSECNSTRMSIPFKTWIDTIPNSQEKLQRHFDEIQKLINEGRFSSKYDFYVLGVAKTIRKISNGRINIKTIEKGSPELGKIFARRKFEKIKLIKRINERNDEIDNLSSEIQMFKRLQKTAADAQDIQFMNFLVKQTKINRRKIDKLRNKINEDEKELKLLNAYNKKYSYYFA